MNFYLVTFRLKDIEGAEDIASKMIQVRVHCSKISSFDILFFSYLILFGFLI